MGTELYARGVALDVNFDELNVTRPDLVKSVHQDYVAAGAEFLETNTYGANRGRLQGYGLESCLTDINAAGVKLARDAADGKAFVAGSIGSLPSEEYSDDPIVWTPDDVYELFKEQAIILADAGANLILLETFSDFKCPDSLLLLTRRPPAHLIAAGRDRWYHCRQRRRTSRRGYPGGV